MSGVVKKDSSTSPGGCAQNDKAREAAALRMTERGLSSGMTE